MITEIRGDLLDQKGFLLLHQVNCKGVMGAGIALQIKNKHPKVYKEYCNVCGKKKPEDLLGAYQIINGICNIFGQLDYGKGQVQTNMDAVRQALASLSRYCVKYKVEKIALPYKMGCGLAGGNWADYMNAIVDFESLLLKAGLNPEIRICKL